LIKLDTAGGGIAGAVIAFFEGNWRMFNHANIRVGFGRMSWLLTSPQMHRVHHSRLPEHQNKNYASVFPIFDVIFGTYYHPRRDEFPPTGVPGAADVLTFSEALTLPFREWWQRLYAWRRRHTCAMPAKARRT
jgi:sterol desaturase/sphingolipid hydroxylase (fatty acid hydroxylase superfamily)